MSFEIIVILVVVLFIAAIFFNAVQQHRAKIEAEKRAEVAKHKAIIDETENVIMACGQFPVSQKLIVILQTRILSALKAINEVNSDNSDIKQRIKDQEKVLSETDPEAGPAVNEFTLPDTDKLIIQYIQGVKKLRILLRSEHSKGKIDTKTYIEEDKQLERLQLKVNVETLGRRAAAALKTNMLGSARQYLEKAIAAMENQNHPDDYTIRRLAQFRDQLAEIQDQLKNANAQDRAKKKEEERDELDELFAPKKKW
ncbi:hypothetical protein DRW07_07230 [Alteromonas sediminis]|uniref:DNA repair protein n=1 Tax=Alteromonas sediminis TaxID=2259342 RepID=A0A3N5Y0S9_9ALTE|nr:hypothetical protein [Alteromonas sediminis]RPJ67317.1 hypothetical protein DRW07_07230 [Alteromonas sediminis]